MRSTHTRTSPLNHASLHRSTQPSHSHHRRHFQPTSLLTHPPITNRICYHHHQATDPVHHRHQPNPPCHPSRHAHHDKLSCSPCLNPKLAVNPHDLGKSLWSEPVSICGGSNYPQCTKKRQSGLTRFVITNLSMDNFPPIETLPPAPEPHSERAPGSVVTCSPPKGRGFSGQPGTADDRLLRPRLP